MCTSLCLQSNSYRHGNWKLWNLNCNTYIRSVAKDPGKLFGTLYRSRNYLTLYAMLYLYKSQIMSNIEYRFHMWAEGGYSHTAALSKLKMVYALLTYDLFSTLQPHTPQAQGERLSLSYHYFTGKCETSSIH